MGIPAPFGVAGNGVPPAGDQANIVVSGTLGAVGPGIPCPVVGNLNISVWPSINTTLTVTAGSLNATVASASGLAIGNLINSAYVPPGTMIGNLVSTTVTLALPPVSLVGNVVSGSNIVSNLFNTAPLLGSTVTGPGIPSGATVVAITSPSVLGTNALAPVPGAVQLSANATVSNAAAPLSFAVTTNGVTSGGADTAATFTGSAMTYSGTVEIERSFDGGSTWLPYCWPGSTTLAKVTGGAPFSTTILEPELQVLYRVACSAYTSGTINYRLSQTLPQMSRW